MTKVFLVSNQHKRIFWGWQTLHISNLLRLRSISETWTSGWQGVTFGHGEMNHFEICSILVQTFDPQLAQNFWPPVEKSCASNGGLVFGRCFSCKVFWIKDVRLLPPIFWHHRCRGRHLRIADMLSTPLFHVCPGCEKPTPAGSLKDAHPEFVLDCLTVNIQYRSRKTGQDFLAINSLRQPLHSSGHAVKLYAVKTGHRITNLDCGRSINLDSSVSPCKHRESEMQLAARFAIPLRNKHEQWKITLVLQIAPWNA